MLWKAVGKKPALDSGCASVVFLLPGSLEYDLDWENTRGGGAVKTLLLCSFLC